MLATGCIDRRPTAIADRDAGPAIAMASGDTITPTVTNTITAAVAAGVATTVTTAGSSTASSSTAPTTSAAAFGQHRACRQSSDCESEHEHSESCHVAPPPLRLSRLLRARCPPADSTPNAEQSLLSIGHASTGTPAKSASHLRSTPWVIFPGV